MEEKLALYGGPKAKTTPNIPMYPGGLEIGELEKKEVCEVLDNQYLFRYYGPKNVKSKVRTLEERFMERTGAKYALATSSCTGALISSLVGCGVGPGDEVIVSAYTFFASCAAIVAAKAIPVIAEVDETLTIDPDDIERKITPRTKAMVVVHMRGVPCNMDRIMEIKEKYGLKLIEDVAQACGGTYKGKYLGTFGDCGCFSFQYHKVITAGEGGMVLMNDERTFARVQNYHDTGACWRPDRFGAERFSGELFVGSNYRMGELAGAVMVAQETRLDGLIAKMRHNQQRIIDGIKDLPGIKIRPRNDDAGDIAICLMFYVETPEKAKLVCEALHAEGVEAGSVLKKGIPDWHIYTHWVHIMQKKSATDVPCPWECPYYREKAPAPEYDPNMCPRTLELLSRVIQLHIPPQMTDEDCDMTVKAIRKVAEALL